MWELIRRYPVGFALALGLHLVIVALMVFGLDWLHPPQPVTPKGAVVQARLVETPPPRKIAPPQPPERTRAEAERKRLEAERKKRLEAEKKRKAEAEKRRREAERRRKAEAEKKRLEAESAARRQAEREAAAKRAELERKKRLEEKKRREAEARRKAEEAERKRAEAERKRFEAERKKRLEAEKKRKAEAEKRRREAERRRKAEAEKKRREAESAARRQAEQDARERDRITAAIKRKVEGAWIRPPGSGRGLEAQVRVRLARNGSVLLVQVIKSSGNLAFDRSVEAAVYKADPLPMPESPRLIEEFRDFTFIFRPSNP